MDSSYAFVGNNESWASIHVYGSYDVRAHAGPADTNTVLNQAHAGWESSRVGAQEVTGIATAILASTHVAPWPDGEGENEIIGDRSVLLEVNCEKPARMISVEASRSYVLADYWTMTGGAGVYAGAGAGAAEAVQATFVTESVMVFAWRGYDNVLRATIQYPGGQSEWLLSPATSYYEELRGGPGAYRVQVEHVTGPYIGHWYVALLGFDQLATIDELERFASV